jgi:EAL domain-containing protein (putative c-di-GMP-specific phosphodiesterase class I)
MGLTTVAEGIEREDQRAAMLKLGCKIGQGYIFAKAMPADQVLGFMAALKQDAKATPNEQRLSIAS